MAEHNLIVVCRRPGARPRQRGAHNRTPLAGSPNEKEAPVEKACQTGVHAAASRIKLGNTGLPLMPRRGRGLLGEAEAVADPL
eukprot:362301-Chlamydomonas_euryale.AAC.5